MEHIRMVLYSADSAAMNLAIEEAIVRAVLEGEVENTIRFWVNPPCVVVGRFQVAHLNCNLDYCKNQNIEVVRRESSGGAVYQDLGNWNHSIFLSNVRDFNINEKNAYEFLSSLMVLALHKLGIPAKFSPPNDILLNNKKISGAAQFELYKTFLHHATLLVTTDLNQMQQSLQVPNEKFADKSANSISQRVTTLEQEGYGIKDIKTLAKTYAQIIEEKFSLKVVDSKITLFEMDLAKELYELKYSTKEWNIDLIPFSEHLNWINYKLPLGLLQIGVCVAPSNILADIEFSGDLSLPNFEPFNRLRETLMFCPLKKAELVRRILNSDVIQLGLEPDKLAELILKAASQAK